MVTLIMRDKMEWELDIPYNFTHTVSLAGGRIKKTTTETYEKVDTTLVLVSQSIINQWYEEILKTPLTVRMVASKKSIESVMIENYDVILVTPTMYNGLVLKHSQYAWKRFIFDEPGHLKVPGMRKIFAGFIWLVTATPDAIIYKHRKCRSSFMTDIINSGNNAILTNEQGETLQNSLISTLKLLDPPYTDISLYQPVELYQGDPADIFEIGFNSRK
jgi:hypothetical protein